MPPQPGSPLGDRATSTPPWLHPWDSSQGWGQRDDPSEGDPSEGDPSESDPGESDLRCPHPLHGDAAGSAQSHVNFPSAANTSRCSASCDEPLSPLLPLLCHRSSLTHLHWGQDTLSPVTGSTQHGIRSCILSLPLLWLFARGAGGAGRGRTMFQPPSMGKGIVT